MALPHLSLSELEHKDAFLRRHIGPSLSEQEAMLRTIGLSSLRELIEKTIPLQILESEPLALEKGKGEEEALAEIRALAEQNQVLKSFIGMGYYGTHTPSVILRNVLENPGWYTAYTPYQAEISQGHLEAILNFQTMISDLTGLDIANSSMLDEATAAAEAMTFARRVAKTKAGSFFVDEDCFPQTLEVIQTRAEPIGVNVVVGNPQLDLKADEVFGALFQYPACSGKVVDHTAPIQAVKDAKGLAVMAADLLALTLLKAPGELGADVVVGSAQRFGVPMGFGGPHAGYFATRDAYKRSIPGRLVGRSVDARGRPALRLALQTREQHIRREKANSNICTAQVLLANIAGFYAVYHGPDGLKRIAQRVARLASVFAGGIQNAGLSLAHKNFFDTVVVKVEGKATALVEKAKTAGMNLRLISPDEVGLSFDETTTAQDVESLWNVFGVRASLTKLDRQTNHSLPSDLLRGSAYLASPVFNSYRSETDMMRYLRRLMDKDIGLDRSVIPLGSCTMKLNAASEMLPITWPAFNQIHPFAPLDQARGYIKIIEWLEATLCEVTGYDAVSLQPNAGSQGEYAGLLAIKRYHESQGDPHRNICLIPSSAHGTNPASATMVGMKVVIVECDGDGNVDLNDLSVKAQKHADNLAACMITYPSTHGVFEEAVRQICEIIHANGGQVYIDGANMNAMVGLAKPGSFGGDVSHLNLHKTFCIPHGGGGPGVGPVGVRKHLKPFLPSHSLVRGAGPALSLYYPRSAVSAAPWGSASILPISWMYLKMMGSQGLRNATEVAILSANYVAKRLCDYYPILYTAKNGLVAHECIIDLRPLKDETGVSIDDVAKRLIDFGFHAPTMSFPVAGTFMIEPTESESKIELDRFIEAMIQIRKEIDRVSRGDLPKDDNMLCNAPHTAEVLTDEEWKHPYSRKEAVYPLESLKDAKYWPPSARVDNVFGDRNLVCSCPSPDDYREAAE